MSSWKAGVSINQAPEIDACMEYTRNSKQSSLLGLLSQKLPRLIPDSFSFYNNSQYLLNVSTWIYYANFFMGFTYLVSHTHKKKPYEEGINLNFSLWKEGINQGVCSRSTKVVDHLPHLLQAPNSQIVLCVTARMRSVIKLTLLPFPPPRLGIIPPLVLPEHCLGHILDLTTAHLLTP